MHICFLAVTLLVCVRCSQLLLCCVVFRVLAWHSVMETTMVEPVWRGAFTPWHQTWHRELTQAFQLPSYKPSLLFSPSFAGSQASVSAYIFLPFLYSSPSLPLSLSIAVSPFISPPVSPLNFVLSFAPQRLPFTVALRDEQNVLWKSKACPEMPSQLDFWVKSGSRSSCQSYFVFLVH